MQSKDKYINQYRILKTIGTGGFCKVKLAEDTHNGNKRVAVKILNGEALGDDEKKMLYEEINMMQNLNHKYCVRYLNHGQAEYVKPSGTKQVSYIALEIAELGELFDFVANTGAFSEPVCRYYFQQMCEGLQYCHKGGVFHRDMKAENIFMDTNYDLKIGDFGLAATWGKQNNDGLFQTLLGTPGYMAPEINLKQLYNGAQVDVFASGVILFIMIAGHPAFGQATPQDPHYKALAMGKSAAFWKAHSRNKKEGVFSEEFRDLMEKIWALDPNQRITIDGIMAHPWMQGPVPKQSEIVAEFQKRTAENEAQKEIERQEKKADAAPNKQAPAHRSSNGVIADHEYKKAIKDYIEVKGSPVVLSNHGPDVIEAFIVEYFGKTETSNVSSKDNKYNVKFDYPSHEDEWKFDPVVKFQINLTKKDATTTAIEFTKIKGNQALFLEQIEEMRTKTFKNFALE